MGGSAMRVARSPQELEVAGPEQLSVTVGNFDGVHVGHLAVLTELRLSAESRGGVSVVVTFDPHPVAVVSSGGAPPLLTPTDEKEELVSQAGVSALLVVDFTREVAAMGAREFLSWVGVGSGTHLVLGYDFRMGRGRSGDLGRLSEIGAELGYGLDVVPAVEFEGRPVSSSRIRAALAAGDVRGANAMLGRPYSLTGKVIAGEGTGRVLDTPTANLELPPGKLFPSDGVYLVAVESLGGRPGLLYVGSRPTFGGEGRRAEVHVLDIEGSLYGSMMSVGLVERLREERKFASEEELARQLKEDVLRARDLAGRGGWRSFSF